MTIDPEMPAPPERDKCLAMTNPDIATEWHPTRNGAWTPRHVTPGQAKVRGSAGNPWWLCTGCQTPYRARIIDRTRRKSGCRRCGNQRGAAKRRRPTQGESFGEQFPHLLPELDISANSAQVDPFQARAGCADEVWWCCAECGHRYQATFARRAQTRRSDGRHRGCGECGLSARAKITRTRNTARALPKPGASFADLEPELLKEWDHDRTHLRDQYGNELGPPLVRRSARHRVHWRCPSGHRYRAQIRSRTGRQRTGCPKCAKTGLSRPERLLRLGLADHYDVQEGFKIPNRLSSTHPTWQIDAYLPSVNLVVEYDGAYWHGPRSKSKREMRTADQQKSLDIRDQGFTLIRVRQEPLEALHEHDVTFPADASMEAIVDVVLERIRELRPD